MLKCIPHPHAVVMTDDTVECLSVEGQAASISDEFVPERAFAIIEREDEFSTRATRWAFQL